MHINSIFIISLSSTILISSKAFSGKIDRLLDKERFSEAKLCCEKMKKKYQGECFEKLANAYLKSHNIDLYLEAHACYEKLGNKEKAEECYRKYADKLYELKVYSKAAIYYEKIGNEEKVLECKTKYNEHLEEKKLKEKDSEASKYYNLSKNSSHAWDSNDDLNETSGKVIQYFEEAEALAPKIKIDFREYDYFFKVGYIYLKSGDEMLKLAINENRLSEDIDAFKNRVKMALIFYTKSVVVYGRIVLKSKIDRFHGLPLDREFEQQNFELSNRRVENIKDKIDSLCVKYLTDDILCDKLKRIGFSNLGLLSVHSFD